MKTKFLYLFALATMVFMGCKSDEPFDTQSPSDEPRILVPYNVSYQGSFAIELETTEDEALYVDSVIVTPSRYTTVNWYIDEQLAHTGVKIEVNLVVGTHSLRIEAVTTEGKTAERKGTITVKKAAVNPDPEEPEDPEPIDPETPTTELWTGNTNLKWDSDNIKLTSDLLADVPAGSTIYIEFTIMPEDDENYYDPNRTDPATGEPAPGINIYQALRIITDWNGDNDILPQQDMAGKESPFAFVYDEHRKELVETIGSMSLVGWGLYITKISYN